MTIKGQKDEQHRYVTAHVDTLGAIVRAVKPDGRLKMDRIGGFPWNMIEGENCTVHVASTGQKVSGTILIHQTSAMSIRMQELLNAHRTIWKCVWMQK